MQNGACDHVIFEGPPGVGKRTMIWAMLREAYGPDKGQVTLKFVKYNRGPIMHISLSNFINIQANI